jgi:hypothetical protein
MGEVTFLGCPGIQRVEPFCKGVRTALPGSLEGLDQRESLRIPGRDFLQKVPPRTPPQKLLHIKQARKFTSGLYVRSP